VEIDRQAIERRDFPIVRRGYEPAAVDAHLRALAAEMEQLSRDRGGGEEPSLAAAASSQVQSILRAAEQAGAEIEREALERASNLRGDADSDAQRTREEAIASARAHLAAVAQAASALLQRVATIDGEVSALLDSLRDGAGRVSSDVAALDASMGELYDAAAGQAAAPARGEHAPASAPAPSAGQERQAERAEVGEADAARAAGPITPPAAPAAAAEGAAPADNGDRDGARLVALNMALSGEPRAATERYLAEHFQLAGRQALIDEVYAAIEA
jgi:hypothetical protein